MAQTTNNAAPTKQGMFLKHFFFNTKIQKKTKTKQGVFVKHKCP